jgi:hypothetical protein
LEDAPCVCNENAPPGESLAGFLLLRFLSAQHNLERVFKFNPAQVQRGFFFAKLLSGLEGGFSFHGFAFFPKRSVSSVSLQVNRVDARAAFTCNGDM